MVDKGKEFELFAAKFNKRLMMLYESGSGTYGFKSCDSDTDIRGVYVEDIKDILSLRPSRDVIDGFSDGRTVDWSIFEVKKFLSLLVKPNFNVLEWVYTPLQFMEYPDEIRKIADMSLSQTLGDHVRGWSYHMYKMDWNNPKKCIYAICPLMCYINLCERREFVSDVMVLAPRFDLEDHVNTLIELYMEGKNTGEDIKQKNVMIYDKIAFISNQIEKDSWLPERTSDSAVEAANDFLVRTRIEGIDG